MGDIVPEINWHANNVEGGINRLDTKLANRSVSAGWNVNNIVIREDLQFARIELEVEFGELFLARSKDSTIFNIKSDIYLFEQLINEALEP